MSSSLPIRAEISSLSRLAAPVVVVQLGLMLMGVVDSMMVGHFSPDALAAVALGNTYTWGLLVFGVGVMLSVDPIASQAHGAGDQEGIRSALHRGLVLALIISAVLAVAWQYAAPILRLLGQQPDVVPTAAAFVRATTLSLPAFFIFGVIRQTLQAMNIVRPVVIAVIIGNLVNIIGNAIFVYGLFGFPALGAVGSGWSTTVSRFVMTAVLAYAAGPRLGPGWWRPTAEARDRRALAGLVRIGVPIGLQMGFESWVFLTVSLILGHMGKTILAAHQIGMNLASLSFMVPLGIGAAGAVRVGNAVGQRDLHGARRSAFVALGCGASVMVVSASAFSLLPRLLARLYTPDAEVIGLAAQLLPIAALFQIFDGTQAVGCGVLRGIADTRAAAIINLVGYWVLGLPLGLVLTYGLGWGPKGLWWGLTVGLAIVAVLLVLRVRTKFGRDLSQIERVIST